MTPLTLKATLGRVNSPRYDYQGRHHPHQPSAAQRRKRIGKVQLICLGIAFVLVGSAAVAAVAVSTGSGQGDPPAAAADQATSASATPPSELPSPPAATTTAPAAPASPRTNKAETRPSPSTTHSRPRGVRPNALCSPAGAIGFMPNGKRLRCGPSERDSRNRWRLA